MKTYRIRMIAGCAVMLAIGASGLPASTINLGTGQSGTVNTASDPIWSILGAPTGNTSGPAVLIGDPIWGAAPAGLHWIATDPSPADSGGTQYLAGDYMYATTFNGGAGLLTFSIKADNAVTVYLNTIPIYNWGDPAGILATGWATFSPTQIITTGFLPVNTLELIVHNNDIYTGVVLQGGFTPTPEPATFAFLTSGLGLIALKRWQRKSA